MSAQLSLPGVKWPPPPRPPPRLPEKRLPRPIAPILGSPPAIKQQRGMCGRAREFVRRHCTAGAHRLARAFRLSVDRSNGLRHTGDRVQQRLRPRNRRRWVDWFLCRKKGGGGCRQRPTISALSRCHPAALRTEVYGTADGARISCRLSRPHRETATPTAASTEYQDARESGADNFEKSHLKSCYRRP